MFSALLFMALVYVPSDCPPGATSQNHQDTDGIVDNFASPNEPTSQSAILSQLPHDWAPFDWLSPNRHFGHTITNLPCTIHGATLTMKIRVTSSLAHNDNIALQATGGSPKFSWSHNIQALLGQDWNSIGQVATLQLDLANLPLSGGGTTSLIDEINAAGYLDIFMQDDTAVDYITISADHCVTDDCNNNGIDDSCEASGVFTCPSNQNINLESGQCCADLTLRATYGNVCQSGEYVITNDYDPSQGGSVTACFEPGKTDITFSLYTTDGTIEHCTVTVNVTDTTPPTITLCPEL